MHALIVYCHPEPRSFNGTLKDVAMNTLRRIGDTRATISTDSARRRVKQQATLPRGA